MKMHSILCRSDARSLLVKWLQSKSLRQYLKRGENVVQRNLLYRGNATSARKCGIRLGRKSLELSSVLVPPLFTHRAKA